MTFIPQGQRRPSRAALALATVLLVAGGLHAADDGVLYRWTEADGTLTFSPTPPTDGRPYERVGAETASLPRARAAGPARTGTRAPAPERIAPVVPLSAAPAPAAADKPAPAPAAAVPAVGVAASRAASAAAAAADAVGDGGEAVQIVASHDKARRCDELRKRIVSLERRLATELTATDMDNTVVHMARYQSNLDRHCR